MSDSLYIFDFDGTLADSFAVALSAYNRVAPRLQLHLAQLEQLPRLRTMPIGPLMAALGISMWKLPQIMLAVRQEMRGYVSSISPFPGVIEAIQQINQKGARLAIVSSNSQENVERFLEQHQLTMFEQIDAGVSLFGKGTRLRRLIGVMKANKNHIAYIGDTVADVRAAQEAKIPSVAVTWGFSHRNLLENESPDVLADHPQDLPKILAELAQRHP